MSTPHKHWIGRVLSSVGHFFSGGLKAAASVAVTITEEVKTLFSGGLIKGVADFIDAELKNHLATDIVATVNAAIPNILAVELAIQGLPDNPTGDDILTFENNVYKAITGLSPTGTSKLYTTLSAQIYDIIKPQIDANVPLTWAVLVEDVEQAYQSYQNDIADQNNNG